MNIRVLLDLKPAFDGYAGIPQETRLLFKGLRSIENLQVKGLIQHGGRSLRPALTRRRVGLSPSEQINVLSKFIVSLHERPHSSLWEEAADRVSRSWALNILRSQTKLGLTVSTSTFDSTLFPDFIWRTLFDKTLNSSDRDTVSNDTFTVIKNPRIHFQKAGLKGASNTSFPNYPRIDTRGYDYFLAQTPFPGRVSPGTKLLVRYHDAVPVLMPHTISDKAFHQASHYQALRSNIRDGAHFSCISEATRNDLLKIFPEAESQTSVIHNIVSEEYHEDDSSIETVASLIKNRLAGVSDFKQRVRLPKVLGEDFKYVLMVSTIEPRKNHLLLVSAWEQLRYSSHPKLKLIIIGNTGWDQGPVMRAFKPWAERGELYYLANVPSAELRVMYQHAAATVCPSLAEGFDYSGIEAMLCGCPVASSDIPVHREIYQDASLYFNPYSVDAAAIALREVLSTDGSARFNLQKAGRRVSQAYSLDNILPVWHEFFNR